MTAAMGRLKTAEKDTEGDRKRQKETDRQRQRETEREREREREKRRRSISGRIPSSELLSSSSGVSD